MVLDLTFGMCIPDVLVPFVTDIKKNAGEVISYLFCNLEIPLLALLFAAIFPDKIMESRLFMQQHKDDAGQTEQSGLHKNPLKKMCCMYSMYVCTLYM